MAYFLGIDGGGTKTVCLVGDEVSTLGTGASSGSNVIRVGEGKARESLHAAILQACQAAGLTPAQIQRASIGAAGAAGAQSKEIVRRLVAEIIPCRFEVLADTEIALEAAFGEGPGVIVIAGTGSVAYGRNAGGDTARAGGWGFAISDEGSGYWIGRTAVAAAVREGNQDRGDCLLKLIAKAWGVATHEQVVRAANTMPAPDFAALFPLVLQASEKNNHQARAVLVKAGGELSALARPVIDRLFPGASTVPVAMSGGVFEHSSLVREVFYNSLQAASPNVELSPAVIEPVQGALQRARRGG